jgi:hypothetical protein
MPDRTRSCPLYAGKSSLTASFIPTLSEAKCIGCFGIQALPDQPLTPFCQTKKSYQWDPEFLEPSQARAEQI